MKVFVAGATGAVGRPLVRRLIAAGHEVVGTTRDAGRAAALREQGAQAVVLDALDLGAQAVVLDALDLGALAAAISDAEPEVVVHQLTAYPRDQTPDAMRAAVALTGRLRRETVPALLDAARAVGARRAIVQSISFVTRPDGRPVHDEDAPLFDDHTSTFIHAVDAVRDMEAAIASADGLERVVLRYGFLSGPGTWYDRDGSVARLVREHRQPVIGDGAGRASFVHVDDAADATVLALDRGAPGTYNVCDDEPAPQRDWLPEFARLLGAPAPARVTADQARQVLSDTAIHHATALPGNANGRAKAAFGWAPPSWRERFREVFA